MSTTEFFVGNLHYQIFSMYVSGFTLEEKCQELGKIERNLKNLVKLWLDAACYRVYVKLSDGLIGSVMQNSAPSPSSEKTSKFPLCFFIN